MAKAGKQFELVVSDVVKEMDRGATVHQGMWVVGPDGERELDVLIEGNVDGVQKRVQIECRDYNPERRPIGIGHIDALDSKHRDLKIDVSLLCSNAGFTIEAIRKARRLGIGLIGVLRENDDRIKYRVIDEVYLRRIDFVANGVGVDFDFAIKPFIPNGTTLAQFTYSGLPIFDWLKRRVLIFITSNQIVRGHHSLRFRFKKLVECEFPTGTALLKEIRVRFRLDGRWIAQRVEIDATTGLYNWLRRTIHVGPGAGKIIYKDVKFGTGGDVIRRPPDFDVIPPTHLTPGEVSMFILDVGGLDVPDQFPQLDGLVVDDDLIPTRPNLPDEAFCSF
jgi:hypothetical protein